MNFTSDSTEAIEGVLSNSRGPWLTLHDASGLKAGQPPMPIPGDVVVHRSQIKFLQVTP